MAVRGLPADAELAPDLGQRQLFNPRQQEHLARARWQRGDDRVEVAQLFGVEQSLLGQCAGSAMACNCVSSSTSSRRRWRCR